MNLNLPPLKLLVLRTYIILIVFCSQIIPQVGAPFTYSFDDNRDEVICDKIRPSKVTDQRRLSTTPLKWKSAYNCCRKKGMLLHTPENGDERTYLYEELGKRYDPSIEYWSSGNNFMKSGTEYTWFWGKNLNIPTKNKPGHKLETHSWGEGQENKTGGCVAIQAWPENKGLKLIKDDCNKPKPFICLLMMQIGGFDLLPEERQICERPKLLKPIPGAEDLRWGIPSVRWKVADYCCYKHNMVLAGNLLPRNDELRKGLLKLYKGDIDTLYFWTSYNDFCKDSAWHWSCESGSNADSIWRDENPDNYGLREDCGQFYWKNGDELEVFYANDYDCDIKQNFICQTQVDCEREKQYFNCPYKGGMTDARIMNPEDNWEEDEEKCGLNKYTFVQETESATYYVSDQEISWIGAMNCLAKANLTSASFLEEDEIAFFNKYIRSLENETEFWNTATSYRRGHNGERLKWPDGTVVLSYNILPYRNHDRIDPVCGKTTMYNGRVGIMTENCLNRLKWMYKITKPVVPRILPLNICPNMSPAKMSKYQNTCSKMWHTVDPLVEEPPYDDNPNKTLASLGEEDLFKIRHQNKLLKNILVDFNTGPYAFPVHNPHRGFKLLSLSTSIYIRFCPQVPSTLLVNAFKYFHHLHWSTSQGRTELLDLPEYKWVVKLLHRCYTNSSLIRFRTDSCDEMITSKKKCDKPICVDNKNQFNINTKDPLMEMMWRVFELVHSACFPYFIESYRMFHKYSQAVMDLWSPAMKLRWFNQIESNAFWEKILGPLYDLHLTNMDKCNEAIIPKRLNVRLHSDTIPTKARLVGGKDLNLNWEEKKKR